MFAAKVKPKTTDRSRQSIVIVDTSGVSNRVRVDTHSMTTIKTFKIRVIAIATMSFDHKMRFV